VNLLVRMKFGSHLYGTDTKKSDTDYKGIYLPTLREVVLHKDKKSIHLDSNKVAGEKNTRDDIDYEIHSIQHFLKLAYKGEAVTLDMLHCPKGWEETSSPEWEFLKQNRKKFYTKGLKAYLGYCRTQASKYGIKGSRLADAEKVLNFLKQNDPTIKLKDI